MGPNLGIHMWDIGIRLCEVCVCMLGQEVGFGAFNLFKVLYWAYHTKLLLIE
jgi:hypothetical protein